MINQLIDKKLGIKKTESLYQKDWRIKIGIKWLKLKVKDPLRRKTIIK